MNDLSANPHKKHACAQKRVDSVIHMSANSTRDAVDSLNAALVQTFKNSKGQNAKMSQTKKATTKVSPISSRRRVAVDKPEPPNTPAPAVRAKPIQFSEFTTKWREGVTKELTERFNTFLESGLPEEKMFLKETLFNWESRSTKDGVHGYDDLELPFLTTLFEGITNMHVMQVQGDMVEEVEQFITAKIEAGWKAPKYTPTYAPESREALEERTRKLLLRHMDYFTYYCRQEEMVFLIDMMEQWETIYANNQTREGTKHRIAAAAEIQLDILRRREEWLRDYECRQKAKEVA